MNLQLNHFEVRLEPFESRALAGNGLGDPATRLVPVLLPRGRAAGARAPAIVFLAGYAGSGRGFLNFSAWGASLPERLDALRERGLIGDVIALCPDGFTRYGGSQYINSATNGRYEDMVAEDLVAWGVERFGALDGPDHWAVAGKSSGGYGALVLGMRRADVFGAVACHSGDMYFEYGYLPDFPKLLRQLEKHGGLGGFLEAFRAARKKTSELVMAMSLVAMAAAYSPAPDTQHKVELPFDPATGELRAEVWARWLEHDPVRLVERHAASLRKLRLLFLDCGRMDQFHLQFGLRILARKLKALGVPCVVEEFDDDHSDTSYRYDESVPRLWEAIRQEAKP